MVTFYFFTCHLRCRDLWIVKWLTVDKYINFPLRKTVEGGVGGGAASERGPHEEQQMEALSKCQSVLEREPAQCVRGPGRRSSHQSGWSAGLSGCSSAWPAASPPGCSPVSGGAPAGCASWWCWPSAWPEWLRTPCRWARVSGSRNPSGTPSSSAPGSSCAGPSRGNGRDERVWLRRCCPSLCPSLRSHPPPSSPFCWVFWHQGSHPHSSRLWYLGHHLHSGWFLLKQYMKINKTSLFSLPSSKLLTGTVS